LELANQYIRESSQTVREGWNRFWFTPTDPATLGLIRICAGAMILYTHAVWTLDFEGLLGPDALLRPEFFDRPWAWSHFNWITSPGALWIIHIATLVIMAMLTVGLFSRTTSVLTFLLLVSYAHRADGMLFGLDQINGLLAMYLMVGPCGGAYSVDRLIRRRRNQSTAVEKSASANVAIRLIQLHMCVIYLFAGLGKLHGPGWWDGSAMFMSVVSYEYHPTFPPCDLTWMAAWPRILELITQVTIVWEIFYVALIWPKLTRPIVLALAVIVHLGIALAMAMITFGVMMIIGNLAFVSPAVVRHVEAKITKKAAAD
jgi:hypothetical protein